MKIFLFFLLFIVLILIYSLIENRFLKITRYHVIQEPNGSVINLSENSDYKAMSFPQLSVVQLSDLHGCKYGKNNSKLLYMIQLCQPDIIIMTGDMKNKYSSVSEDYYIFLRELSKNYPCIYSMGNHELKDKNKNPQAFLEYLSRLKDCGILISDNETHNIKLKDIDCLFASYSSSLVQYMHCHNIKSSEHVTDVRIPVSDSTQADIRILLSHDPELREFYCNSEYGLIFSGHLHGGIVRIPGYRGILSTRFVLFPQYEGGCYSLDKKHVLIVSRGLGSHTIKFRLFNRPEIVHTRIYFKK